MNIKEVIRIIWYSIVMFGLGYIVGILDSVRQILK